MQVVTLPSFIRPKIFLLCVFLLLIACADQTNSNLPNLNSQFSFVVKKVPDFSSIKDIKEKKTRFFNFMKPLIIEKNKRIIAIRKTALALKNKGIPALSDTEKSWLTTLAKQYKITSPLGSNEFWTLIKKRVDVVPVSLVMAQAAMESAWGTSRFAQQANNLFGQWCYKKGCGLVPSKRTEGARHEVKAFKTVNAAVAAYMRNLNSNKVYTPLRDRRHAIKSKGHKVTGIELASGLQKYSERGIDYVHEIQSMINTNKLYIYDI
jgi:Bax protein